MSVEAHVAQATREKMKIKLREDKIQKLEQEHSISAHEENAQLLKDIELLKEQLEQELNENTNPKLAKLQAELSQAQA